MDRLGPAHDPRQRRTGASTLFLPFPSSGPARYPDGIELTVSPLTQVKLRSFSTNRHKVQGLVAYRLGQDII